MPTLFPGITARLGTTACAPCYLGLSMSAAIGEKTAFEVSAYLAAYYCGTARGVSEDMLTLGDVRRNEHKPAHRSGCHFRCHPQLFNMPDCISLYM